MSTIMNRKGAEFWMVEFRKQHGIEPWAIPKEAHSFVIDHPGDDWKMITWSDIHKKRQQRDERCIRFKRMHGMIKLCIVWVFYIDYWLFGGYYTVIKTINDEVYLNFRGRGLSNRTDEEHLKLEVMDLFPLGIIPIIDNFEHWMKTFIETYSNKTFYGGKIKQGINYAHAKFDQYGYLEGILNKKT